MLERIRILSLRLAAIRENAFFRLFVLGQFHCVSVTLCAVNCDFKLNHVIRRAHLNFNMCTNFFQGNILMEE